MPTQPLAVTTVPNLYLLDYHDIVRDGDIFRVPSHILHEIMVPEIKKV
jgi:hypothetical protein